MLARYAWLHAAHHASGHAGWPVLAANRSYIRRLAMRAIALKTCRINGQRSLTLGVPRHIAVTIGKDKSKGSARIKLKRAAWQNDILASLLAQI